MAKRYTRHMLHEFLSLDRLDSDLRVLHLVTCNPRDIIDSAAAESIPERIALHCDHLPDQFSCDMPLLRVTIDNLLTNALHYSPADSPISLSARGLSDGAVEIAVADAGPGIAEDELAKVFNRYFRGRAFKTRSGAGLGLYLVDHIARLHGGSVRVESAPGQGARFVLLLPGVAGPQA